MDFLVRARTFPRTIFGVIFGVKWDTGKLPPEACEKALKVRAVSHRAHDSKACMIQEASPVLKNKPVSGSFFLFPGIPVG